MGSRWETLNLFIVGTKNLPITVLFYLLLLHHQSTSIPTVFYSDALKTSNGVGAAIWVEYQAKERLHAAHFCFLVTVENK